MQHTDEIAELIEIARKQENQAIWEGSKRINFFLTYKCKEGAVLDPVIDGIVQEIEEWECERPNEPRKRSRTAEANKRFKQAVRILILNLLQTRSFRSAKLYLGVSKDANTYGLNKRYAPPQMTYDAFVEAYNGLEQTGYMEVKYQGFFNHRERGGLCTKVSATRYLFDLYKGIEAGRGIKFTNRPVTREDKDELIILKDEDGRQVDYKETAYTRAARRHLEKVNKILSEHEFALACSKEQLQALRRRMKEKHNRDSDQQLPYLDTSMTRLYRIFSDGSFDRGGRFYRGWWQHIPREYRPYITIDGTECVELDYTRCHITMLYAEMGIAPPKDSYDVHPRVSEEISKQTINALINARGIIKPNKDFNSRKAGISWSEFVELIKTKHAPIAERDLFMSGYGLTLQHHEAELGKSILLYLTERNIPCLPVHDSFIVAKEYEAELTHIMNEAYVERFGVFPGIATKWKGCPQNR